MNNKDNQRLVVLAARTQDRAAMSNSISKDPQG